MGDFGPLDLYMIYLFGYYFKRDTTQECFTFLWIAYEV